MNKVILMGRLTRDPELRQTSNNISVCSFSIAVDRRFKGPDGERKADFINVVAWRQQAEFVSRYFAKGSRIAVVGSLQTRTWEDQQGQRRYATEVIADELYFADSKKTEGGANRESSNSRGESNGRYGASSSDDNDYVHDDGDDMSLPFDLT